MKKILNKMFLCLSLIAMIIPTTYVYAEGEDGEGTTTPTPSESPVPTPTPSESPKPTPEEPTPSEKPEETEKPTPSNDPTPSPTPKEIELSIQGVTMKRNGNKYTAVVPSSTESIQITANGKVQGDGTHALKEGLNTITVTATETGKKYTVEVTRGAADLTLKSLKIQGQSLNESFESDVLNYTADIPHDMENVVIQAGASSPLVTFQVVGDKNLKVGKNTVQIIVKNAAGETKEYRITVTRASKEDDSQTEEDDDKNENAISSVEETNSKIAMPDIEKTNKGNPIRYVLVVIFCLVLLAVSGLGIYFYIKTGDSEKRKQKKIEKLRKKQEKLNSELTTLNNEQPEEKDEILEEIPQEKVTNIDEIDELEDTIELENLNVEEETKEVEVTQSPKRRADRNVLEDFDDLFLDE